MILTLDLELTTGQLHEYIFMLAFDKLKMCVRYEVGTTSLT